MLVRSIYPRRGAAGGASGGASSEIDSGSSNGDARNARTEAVGQLNAQRTTRKQRTTPRRFSNSRAANLIKIEAAAATANAGTAGPRPTED